MGWACGIQGILIANLLERYQHRWEDDFDWILQKQDQKVLDWINLAHNSSNRYALVNTSINLETPLNIGTS